MCLRLLGLLSVSLALLHATPLRALTLGGWHPKVLFYVSNVAQVPGTSQRTGVWAEEVVVPYEIFTNAHLGVIFASPTGGSFVFDPLSLDPTVVTDRKLRLDAQRFRLKHLDDMRETESPSSLGPVIDDPELFEIVALFVPGGQAAMFDLASDPFLPKVAKRLLEGSGIVAAVTQGTCFLPAVKRMDGAPMLLHWRATGPLDAEQAAFRTPTLLPFSIQKALDAATRGGYDAGPPWAPHMVANRHIVTGQNPASTRAVAEETLRLLKAGPHGVKLDELLRR